MKIGDVITVFLGKKKVERRSDRGIQTHNGGLDRVDRKKLFLLTKGLRKAFDKVPHSRLLHKVKSHGIQGEVAKWIRNWLDDRMSFNNTRLKSNRFIW